MGAGAPHSSAQTGSLARSHIHAAGRLGSPACCAEVPTLLLRLTLFGSRSARFVFFRSATSVSPRIISLITFSFVISRDQPVPDPTLWGPLHPNEPRRMLSVAKDRRERLIALHAVSNIELLTRVQEETRV